MLDDAAFGAASEAEPKLVSPSDPAAQWTGALGGRAVFAYATNDLIDTDHAVIVDVEGETDQNSIRWIEFPSNAPSVRPRPAPRAP